MERISKLVYHWPTILVLILVPLLFSKTVKSAEFHNPILDIEAGDPYIYYHTDGYYYFTYTTIDSPDLWVYKSKILTDFRNAEKAIVYRLPTGWSGLWAPEIHFIRGNWYIYFTMDPGQIEYHRMHVIQGLDPQNALGNYTEAIRMQLPEEDYYSIDASILEVNDKLYVVYSGCKENGTTYPESPQNLYIAPMSDPTTINGSRLLLKEPTMDWEGMINEGPEFLMRGDRTFLSYSAQCGDYCLGLMEIETGKDPMDLQNWYVYPEPVFQPNEAEGVFGTGHASFTTSTDLEEVWIAYHAMEDRNGGWHNRTARIQKMDWDEDGTPIFPIPVGFGTSLTGPSGEK